MRFLTLVAMLALLAAAFVIRAAEAQNPPGASLQLFPATPSSPSTLKVTIGEDFPQFTSTIPSSISLKIGRGFKLDPRARATRCTLAQGNAQACPAGSQIGKGQAVIRATIFGVPQTYTAAIGAFLAPASAKGDLAGVVMTVNEPKTGTKRAMAGRVRALASGPYAYELRVEELDKVAPGGLPAGVTVKLVNFSFTAGASRRTSEVRTVRGRRVRRSVVRHLITNPPTCRTGKWGALVRATFPQAAPIERSVFANCTKR